MSADLVSGSVSVVIVFVIIVIVLFICYYRKRNKKYNSIAVFFTKKLSKKTTELLENLSIFSVNLYSECANSSNGNIIISPYSIASAITLLSQGASGQTFDQIINALHLPSDKEGTAKVFRELSNYFVRKSKSITLNVANKIYVMHGYPIRKSFKQVTANKFHSGIESINFCESESATNVINRWVELNTNKKVKNIVSTNMLDDDTRLVLVNGVYFWGKLKHKFEVTNTCSGKFFVSKNDFVYVNYMSVTQNFKYSRFDDLDAAVIELPYDDSDTSLVIVLPNKVDGLNSLEAEMMECDLKNLTEQLRNHEISVIIPKFKIEYEIKLNEVLKTLKMINMFSNNVELRGLLKSSESFEVTEVIHKVYFKLDEDWTKTVTKAPMNTDLFYATLTLGDTFYADHPFLFYIRQYNTTLLAGRVTRF